MNLPALKIISCCYLFRGINNKMKGIWLEFIFVIIAFFRSIQVMSWMSIMQQWRI